MMEYIKFINYRLEDLLGEDFGGLSITSLIELNNLLSKHLNRASNVLMQKYAELNVQSDPPEDLVKKKHSD
jgi:hypothetical protein